MLIRRQRHARARLGRAARPFFAGTITTVPAALGAVLLALAGLWVVLAPAAAAGPGESAFATDSNTLRAAHGDVGYHVCPDLTAIADAWAAHMAATGTLAHNTELATQMAHWDALGENVGEGSNVVVVQAGLVASPPHLANLLSATFTEAGYGTALDAYGTLWVDEVFRQPSGAPCAGGTVPGIPTAPPPPRVVPTGPTVPASVRAPVATTTAAARAHADLLRGVDGASRSTTVRAPADLALVARRRLAAALAVPNQASDPVGLAFAFFGTVTRVVR